MNCFLFVVNLCGFLLVVIEAAHPKLPKGFVHCKQNDAEFDRCVLKGAKLAVPELAKGQPKFGIPPIDPLRISTLFIDQGHGSVNIKLNFTDLDIHGLASSDLKDVTVNSQEPSIKVKLATTKPLVLNGTYTIAGKVLILPITGNGYCKLVLEGFTADATVHFKQTEKNGEIYWHLTRLDFTFDTTKLIMRLDNLFNGDKALGDNMNKFLNENWTILLEELRPAFRTALSTVFSEIAQRFFERVPITMVYPTQ